MFRIGRAASPADREVRCSGVRRSTDADGQGYGSPAERVKPAPFRRVRAGYAGGFSPSCGSGFTPLHRSVASAVPGQVTFHTRLKWSR